MSHQRHLHYAAFDVLWLNGKDLRGLPLTHWRRALDRLIPATTTVVSKVVRGRAARPRSLRGRASRPRGDRGEAESGPLRAPDDLV